MSIKMSGFIVSNKWIVSVLFQAFSRPKTRSSHSRFPLAGNDAGEKSDVSLTSFGGKFSTKRYGEYYVGSRESEEKMQCCIRYIVMVLNHC